MATSNIPSTIYSAAVRSARNYAGAVYDFGGGLYQGRAEDKGNKVFEGLVGGPVRSNAGIPSLAVHPYSSLASVYPFELTDPEFQGLFNAVNTSESSYLSTVKKRKSAVARRFLKRI